MRGGPFHEHIVSQLDQAFLSRGHATERQAATRQREGGVTGYVDLLVRLRGPDGRLLLIEVEMESKRAANDVNKLSEVSDRAGQSATLWIVTPTASGAKAIERLFVSRNIGHDEGVQIVTFGAAIKRVLDNEL